MFRRRSHTQSSTSSGSSASSPTAIDSGYPIKACRWSNSIQRWKHVSPRDPKNETPPQRLKIITYNVDFSSPFVDERIMAVLSEVKVEVTRADGIESDDSDSEDSESELDRVVPCCVLLQEVHVDALETIKQDAWVREHFIVLPRDATKWPAARSPYGNVTLISKDLEVENCRMVRFGKSEMDRGALVVDVLMSDEDNEDDLLLRIVNTHLESLPVGASYRPSQFRRASQLVKENDIDGGIVAGDMNPIDPVVDLRLGESHGLVDAYTGAPNDKNGFTWGYQGGTEGGKYPKARFDKIFYLPSESYEVAEPWRIGVGLRAETYPGGPEPWASDHYGLCTVVCSA